jgi:hypothetical protein
LYPGVRFDEPLSNRKKNVGYNLLSRGKRWETNYAILESPILDGYLLKIDTEFTGIEEIKVYT